MRTSSAPKLYFTPSPSNGCLPVNMSTNILLPEPLFPIIANCSFSKRVKLTGAAILYLGCLATPFSTDTTTLILTNYYECD